MESIKNPRGNLNLVHRRNKTRNRKKEKIFEKNLIIASHGINKLKSKEQSRDKTKKNLDRHLEEKTVEEILKVVQVDTTQVVITNHHNENFHEQKSNLEHLVKEG